MAATRADVYRRWAAAVAGLGAFACTTARAGSTLDLKVLSYKEDDDRTQVVNPALYYDLDLAEKGRIGILAAYDSISGASPTGEAPRLDAVSGASAVSGSIPRATYDDTRQALSASYGRRFGSHLPTATLSYSKESDYLSQGISLVDAWEMPGGRSTLHYGFGTSKDVVDAETMPRSEDKSALSLSVGWTRVLGARDLMDISIGHERLSGYLEDPYKVVTAGGVVVPEIRPDARDRWSAVLKYGHYFKSRGAVKTSYRYYTDDWDVTAHTGEVSYDQRIGRRWIVSPRLRYHTQGAASFFAYEFAAPEPEMSADYRLSSFWSWEAGLGFSVDLGSHLSLNLAVEYLEQTGNDRVRPHPAAPLNAPLRPLVPEDEEEEEDGDGVGEVSPADMRVTTATLGFSFRF